MTDKDRAGAELILALGALGTIRRRIDNDYEGGVRDDDRDRAESRVIDAAYAWADASSSPLAARLVEPTLVQDSLAAISEALEARRWVNTQCGACGATYRRCSYCGVGIRSKPTSGLALAQCGGHKDVACFPGCMVCRAESAVQALRAALLVPTSPDASNIVGLAKHDELQTSSTREVLNAKETK